MPRVLLICSANSIRSPMAEGLWKLLAPDWEAESCGALGAGHLHPMVSAVLAEKGGDLGNFESRCAAELEGERFDLAITLSEEAKRVFDRYPWSSATLHWLMPDPTLVVGDRRAAFRELRDALAARISGYLANRS